MIIWMFLLLFTGGGTYPRRRLRLWLSCCWFQKWSLDQDLTDLWTVSDPEVPAYRRNDIITFVIIIIIIIARTLILSSFHSPPRWCIHGLCAVRRQTASAFLNRMIWMCSFQQSAIKSQNVPEHTTMETLWLWIKPEINTVYREKRGPQGPSSIGPSAADVIKLSVNLCCHLVFTRRFYTQQEPDGSLWCHSH